MGSPIVLTISTGVNQSDIELSLSKKDILELYAKEFGDTCVMCLGPLGNSEGDICCACFRLEEDFHTDCCLAEE